MNPISIFRSMGWLLFFVLLAQSNFAQILNKPVTVNVKRQPVSFVLKNISEQAEFNFSYNSDLLPGDSLVTLNSNNKTVGNTLEMLFPGRFQYKEKGDYLIILPTLRERIIHLSGRITDRDSGEPVDFASVYSRQLLVATLSESDGTFRLRLKDRAYPISLTVSKVGYGDTTLIIHKPASAELQIPISQKAVNLDPLIVRYSPGESTWLGRLFLSRKLREQSRNISRFFVSLPYQASLTPGLGTHGRMSGQVVNKLSLNLLGGYTAGVNGVEIAGGFNLSKEDVQYVQVAGIFNVVSGHVRGVQVAGVHNHILDSLSGLQISGFSGIVKQQVRGVQVAGAYNYAAQKFSGVQVAGAVNFNRGRTDGVQVAGFANIVLNDVRGWQIAPVNVSRNLKGIQLGIVNVADSSSGINLGLFNFIKKSTSNISLSASEVLPFNLSWKTGTHRFYTILTAGTNANPAAKAYMLGAGFGTEFFPYKKAGFFIELVNQNIFLGDWEEMPSLTRLQIAPTWKLNRRFLIYAGPAFSVYYKGIIKEGYKHFPLEQYPSITFNEKVTSWLGWQAGISWRYGKL